MKLTTGSLLLCLTVGWGCTSSQRFDYGPYLSHMPTSILVLPPLNESPEPKAPYAFLSTITEPLAERGYYVFPVAVVDQMMKENGLPTAGEMHQVSHQKLFEVFGADTVLYLVIKSWGTEYQVLNSQTRVTVQARLVDLRTGTDIWGGAHTMARNSSSGSNNILGMMVGALVNQIATSMYDPSYGLAYDLNYQLFCNERAGLLAGRHHPEYERLHAAKVKEHDESKKKQPPASAPSADSRPSRQAR